MPTTLTHSIASYTSGDYLDEISASSSGELVKRRGTNGVYKKGKFFNPMTEFSVKGGGAPELTIGLASFTYTGISGGVKYVTKAVHTEKNSDFDDSDCSGEHLPSATDAG